MDVVILFDGRSYLARDDQGRYTLTTDKEKAVRFTEQSAKNTIKFSLKNIKFLKDKQWHMLKAPMTDEECGRKSNEAEAQEVKERFKDKTESELLQYITDGLEAYCEMETRVELLSSRLHNQTKEREDLEHTIENVRFNAYQGYDFCKKLQTISRNRRVTKKNVQKLDIVRNSSVISNVQSVRDVIRELKKVDESDTYYYRRIKEFGTTSQRNQTLPGKPR